MICVDRGSEECTATIESGTPKSIPWRNREETPDTIISRKAEKVRGASAKVIPVSLPSCVVG